MTVHGRYTGVLSNSPALDVPFNALPGVDQSAFIRSNIPAWAAATDLATVGSGVAIGVPIWLSKGDLVTSIEFLSGATPAGTPTNWWHALLDPDFALLSQSADQLTAAWAASTSKKLALAVPQTAARDGWYYAVNSMTATTPQSLAGVAPLVGTAGLHAGSKPLGFSFGAGLAGVCPATTGARTTVAKCPIVVVS
jgi:hypothetical protein